MILFAEQKQRRKCREQLYVYQGGKQGLEELEDWQGHMYTIDMMYKTDN